MTGEVETGWPKHLGYRPELPDDMPARIAELPIDRGYPVPWFVEWIDGKPDFRVMDREKLVRAISGRLCWICGGKLGRHFAYVSGPMCGVNRTSAEPPGHVSCADWSARACPFLVRPHAKRREAGMPEGAVEAPGVAIKRNPGVAMVWHSEGAVRIKQAPNGILFDLGDPTEVRWYAEGQPASREQVEASIDSGCPALREVAEEEGPRAVAALERMVEDARRLIPA